MKGVSVSTLQPANNSERGKTTWEWKDPRGHQITVYLRYKGQHFAEHFHKGDDPAKNPDQFLLIKGKMSAVFKDLDGNTCETTFDATPGNPVLITIEPWILHGMVALEDCWYFEYRPRYFDPKNPDTYPMEEFKVKL